jgi:endonuclease/exonuclease/phosphatase family metal-dependent hydrolase
MATFDPDFPVIVAGDFNANVASAHNPVFKALFGDSSKSGQASVSGFRTVCDTTVKTSFKNLSSDADRCLKGTPESDSTIDYIYLRDPHGRLESLGCSAHEVRSGSRFFTDHRSLVASFRWR